VFTLIDAAFGQRRKTLHAALKRLVPQAAFEAANIDPTRRGETLTIDEFTRLAAACDRINADGREASA
jgi:16S rRNA (adenine1518-N6/adenine1519-N6)-dimethyltransferase